jgi:hypothetical protein
MLYFLRGWGLKADVVCYNLHTRIGVINNREEELYKNKHVEANTLEC